MEAPSFWSFHDQPYNARQLQITEVNIYHIHLMYAQKTIDFLIVFL